MYEPNAFLSSVRSFLRRRVRTTWIDRTAGNVVDESKSHFAVRAPHLLVLLLRQCLRRQDVGSRE